MTIIEAIGAAIGFVAGSLIQGGLLAMGAYLALSYMGVV